MVVSDEPLESVLGELREVLEEGNFPFLVEIVEERKNGYLGVDYKRLVPLLIQSIKELKQEVEELKKKV